MDDEAKRLASTVDATPTWEQILPTMLTVIESSDNLTAIGNMRGELRRMAILADERNAMVRYGFPPEAVRKLSDDEVTLMCECLRERAEFAREQLASEPVGAAFDALAEMVKGE